MREQHLRQISLMSYGMSIGFCLDVAGTASNLWMALVLYLCVAMFAHAAVVEIKRLFNPPVDPEGDEL